MDKYCSQCGFEFLESENSFPEHSVTSEEIITNNREQNAVNRNKGLNNIIIIIIIIIIISVIIIALGSGYYFHKKFNSGSNVTDKPKALINNTTSTENNKVSDQNVEKSPQGTPNEELNKSSTYLPTLNKKYTYYNKYVDGDEGEVDVWVGHIEGVPLMSMSNIIPQSEVFTEHIVKRDDGIYLIADYNPEIYIKYLPSEILEGASYDKIK
ncbi:hypothetical protein [Clostridium sp.]|uniref:hypothetical protein n=1 Tax=Clostridium sp. TaxID=1506 RepID=UPI003D6C902A